MVTTTLQKWFLYNALRKWFVVITKSSQTIDTKGNGAQEIQQTVVWHQTITVDGSRISSFNLNQHIH